MNIRWLVSPMASAVYAARCLAAGRPLIDPQLAEELAAPLAELTAALTEEGVPPAWWGHALPLAAGISEPRQLAQMALTKTVGRARAEVLAARLARPLRELVRAYLGQFADLAEELELRSGPLRQQWEARGPGLLAAVCRLVDPQLLAPQAEVVLVKPVLGGHGLAHLIYNSVTFEAVLANPHEELPEVVRLGWLLASLHLESGRFGERLPQGRLERIGPLAMVPPVLAAARECELVGDPATLLSRALVLWRLAAEADRVVAAGKEDGLPQPTRSKEPASGGEGRAPSALPDAPSGVLLDANALAERLTTWWETYLSGPVRWAVALEALGELLANAGCEG
ncbi:MAG: hypothetical protein K6T86_04010 [Pirellulales bacterium]|nr:hypothetical protein [Pirellulales bacterium]